MKRRSPLPANEQLSQHALSRLSQTLHENCTLLHGLRQTFSTPAPQSSALACQHSWQRRRLCADLDYQGKLPRAQVNSLASPSVPSASTARSILGMLATDRPP